MRVVDSKFRKKLNDSRFYPIIYELVPPAKMEDSYLAQFDKIIDQELIDAINIPEIHEEKGQAQEKGLKTKIKCDSRKFAKKIINKYSNIDVILNHVVVLKKQNCFENWVKNIFNDYKVSNVIFVGGESKDIKYPGPGVCESANWARDVFNKKLEDKEKLFIGGITIPSRTFENSGLDESERIVNKIDSGVDFFTSQIIYSAETTKNLLKNYNSLCIKKNINPRRIFLSFAPVSKTRDIVFLKWLGVEIPSEIEIRLLESELNMGVTSIKICFEILYEILNYCNLNDIKIPLGLNIEHVMKDNVELSYELLVLLSKLLK